MKHTTEKTIASEGGSEDTSDGGVIAVRRAMAVLAAFGTDDESLSLAELSRRTALHRSTVLRLARTLALDNYLVQKDGGDWRLGRAAGWLGACYQATFNAHDIIEPVLRELSLKTKESATFYIREGNQRTCVVRVEGPQAVRHHVRMGTTLPLDVGGPGLVILAFSGEPGEPYESIRRQGYAISLGARDPQVSSISVPVFGLQWKLLGAICISGPLSRLTEPVLEQYVEEILAAAQQLSYATAGRRPASNPAIASSWHP
ncbi:IclR family transcriptional regulator [Advenella kashmirensis W13003]|uniref:IclR family transcriptional regulator n=1 Tax=Advenella kashmirensis W13003 TaxID=1424334 RepID=V8QQB5_9BURK|nr:IclR family transcriptional regulator [Advenella kashmirensis]ETF01513.1 IclR family transcriptional regulator [Advenella kashmirensis W13003]